MKRFSLLWLAAACSFRVLAQQPALAQPSPAVAARAERLSSQMVRDLRLNAYQAGQLRAINQQKTAQLDQAERELAQRPAELEARRRALARERDQELLAVLSTDQYTDYFDARAHYAQLDRDYARSAAAAALVNAVRNPAPTRDNDAVIRPTPTGKDARRPQPLGSTVRQ